MQNRDTGFLERLSNAVRTSRLKHSAPFFSQMDYRGGQSVCAAGCCPIRSTAAVRPHSTLPIVLPWASGSRAYARQPAGPVVRASDPGTAESDQRIHALSSQEAAWRMGFECMASNILDMMNLPHHVYDARPAARGTLRRHRRGKGRVERPRCRATDHARHRGAGPWHAGASSGA